MRYLTPLFGGRGLLRWLLRLAIWHAVLRYTHIPAWALIVIIVVVIVGARVGRSALRNRH